MFLSRLFYLNLISFSKKVLTIYFRQKEPFTFDSVPLQVISFSIFFLFIYFHHFFCICFHIWFLLNTRSTYFITLKKIILYFKRIENDSNVFSFCLGFSNTNLCNECSCQINKHFQKLETMQMSQGRCKLRDTQMLLRHFRKHLPYL